MTSLNNLSATEIVRGIAAGEFTCEAVTAACLERIEAREPVVKAWATLDRDYALMQARALDRRVGERGPLHGVPIGIKDIIDTEHLPTEMGSPLYKGFRSNVDASCVALARLAGAVILGKTVTAEFAGMTPGPTTNPHNPEYTPGGSSSGSAAAVADMMTPLAYGTQTGGSVLRPASFCGCVGYKPTFNLINRQGIKFAAESLDTIGFIARTIDDVELVTGALTVKLPSFRMLDAPPRVGLCLTPLWETAEVATRNAIEDAAARLGAAGAVIKDVPLSGDFTRLYDAARETINNYERSKAMAADWQHNADRISTVLAGRIRAGFAMRHEDYVAALQLAERCRTAIDAAFDGVDVMLSPCVKGEAPHGLQSTGDPAFQQFWTALHVPAITLPTHRGPGGLPVGIQLVAPRYADEQLFACARWMMQTLGAP